MKAAILGLGISGIESAKFLTEKGYNVFIYDDNIEKLNSFSSKYKIVENMSLDKDTDFLVISPGVPGVHPLVKDANSKKIEIIGELELASRYFKDEKIIALTGTNGKSTTVTLIHALLEAEGKKSFLCGNIGTPLISAVEKGYEFVVIEISSFQLETLRSMKPDVSLILNVSPDHLDRYESYEEYLLTKVHLAKLLKKDGFLVINGGDEALVAASGKIAKNTKFFSANQKSDIIFDGRFVDWKSHKIDMSKTKISGFHNAENIMAALLAVEPWITGENLLKTIYEFNPLPHRMEFVDSIKGVSFIDDSKGTNVGAVEKSLLGFDEKSVVLILGGVDKGGSYDPLKSIIEKKCKGVVLIGQAAPVIRDAISDIIPFVMAKDMEDAVFKSYTMAKSSGTVLLSPACSSYDMYANYKERGKDFIQKVQELRGKII